MKDLPKTLILKELATSRCIYLTKLSENHNNYQYGLEKWTREECPEYHTTLTLKEGHIVEFAIESVNDFKYEPHTPSIEYNNGLMVYVEFPDGRQWYYEVTHISHPKFYPDAFQVVTSEDQL